MTKYQIMEFEDAHLGKHYSVNFELNGNWYIRQLFRTKEEAEKNLNELNSLQKAIDK